MIICGAIEELSDDVSVHTQMKQLLSSFGGIGVHTA